MLYRKARLSKVAVGLLSVAVAALPLSVAQAQTTTNVNTKLPFNNVPVQNPCVAGETVTLSGSLHLVLKVTRNAQGAVTQIQGNFNSQGVSGTGSPSGRKYHGSSTGTLTSVSTSTPHTFNVTGKFRLIGQGPNNNFLGTFTARVVFNPTNNTVTPTLLSFTTECR